MSYSHINGNNALHFAVYFGRTNIVSYILSNEKNLDLEDKNFDGDTVFMMGTMRENLVFLKIKPLFILI